MTQYDDTNRGVLFKNDKQGNENRPDYKGSINVNGQELWLSAWLKTSQAGNKFMSLSVQPKEQHRPQHAGQQSPQVSPPQNPQPAFDDSDIPFNQEEA